MRKRRSSLVLVTLALALLLLSTGMAAAQATLPPDAALVPQSPDAGGGPGPVGTGFTYQGQIKKAGSPVNTPCDFQFSLWDRSGSGTPPSGGTQLGSTETQTNVAVGGGLFTATLNASKQFGDNAFAEARWLQIAVRCPAGSGSYTILSPRQPLWAAPYAMGLRPGTRILGGEYQTLKVQNNTTATGNPAGVTGEILSSLDGVGVYGSNNSTAAGSAGMGVWGRSYNLAGVGVKGTGFNGSAGVFGEANTGIAVKAVGGGTTLSAPALLAEATNTKANEPAGIAIFAKNHGGDATIVTQNTGSGDAFRALNAAGSSVIYRVTATGRVVASAVQIYGGGDLAERFQTEDAEVEPGTLMVIDAEHPGQLKPSTEAYDTRVWPGSSAARAGSTLA